jgi:hypothetical protein
MQMRPLFRANSTVSGYVDSSNFMRNHLTRDVSFQRIAGNYCAEFTPPVEVPKCVNIYFELSPGNSRYSLCSIVGFDARSFCKIFLLAIYVSETLAFFLDTSSITRRMITQLASNTKHCTQFNVVCQILQKLQRVHSSRRSLYKASNFEPKFCCQCVVNSNLHQPLSEPQSHPSRCPLPRSRQIYAACAHQHDKTSNSIQLSPILLNAAELMFRFAQKIAASRVDVGGKSR